MNNHLFSSRSLAFFLLIVLPFGSYSVTNTDDINISHAWLKEAPPGVKILAAYLQIENNSAADITLIEINSPMFETIELHETVIENDIARMLKRESLSIAAKEIVKLEQGGLHLMLIKPKQVIKAGDEVQLTLTFNDDKIVNINIPIIRSTGQEQDHSHHHHH